MEEHLTCSVCEKSWTRTKARGRKPLVCPTCLSSGTTFIPRSISNSDSKTETKTTEPSKPTDLSVSKVHSMMHPRPVNYQDMLESTKKGSKWKCPGCGSILTMLVGITDTPTHRCTPNTVTVKIMERIS
jgi:rubrerythrin